MHMDVANSTPPTGSDTENESDKAKSVPLFINRNFLLLFCAHVVSMAGDVVFDSTLSLWVVLVIARGQPWAPIALGGVLISSIAPTLLFGSIAGVFVDRWIKRSTMLRMDAIRAILLVLLLPLTGMLPLSLGLPAEVKLIIIYVVVFVSGTCTQLFNPSAFALIGEIVPEKYRSRATGFEQTISGLAYIIGPPIAVSLFFALGPQIAVLLNALSFAGSFVAVYAIRSHETSISSAEKRKSSFMQEYLSALRFIVQNRVLSTILIGAFLAVIPVGAQNALGIFFYQKNLQAPLEFFGLMGMAVGIGLIAGALVAAFFTERIGPARMFSGSVLLTGLLMMVYARTTNLVVALVCIFLVGSMAAAVNVAAGPIALGITPKEMVGRVAAIITSSLSLASLLSVAVLSYLASTILQNLQVHILGIAFSTYDTLFVFTGFIAALGGIYALFRLWNVTLSATSEEQTEQLSEGVKETGATV